MSVAPFPFAALPSITRAEILGGRRIRAAAGRHGGAIAEALAELAGAPVTIAVRDVRPAGRPTGVTVWLEDVRHRYAVDVEPALARGLIQRALRQPAGGFTDAARTVSPAVPGAFAAVLHHALRRAGIGPLRVVASGEPRGLTAWLAVSIGGETFDARVTVPEAPAGAPSITLARLGAAPITLPLLVLSCAASRAEVEALRRGDVFVPPEWPLRAEGGQLVGPVALVAPRAERGLRANLAGDGRLVLRNGRAAEPQFMPTVPEPNAATTTLEAALDAPVIVRVELGAVEMTAAEWAALAPGDVVALGRKLGDPAVLRIGGVEVARGELVQVDGEYGVRILG